MKIQIGGQNGAQEVAEGNVDGRTIVERAGADNEELLRSPARFGRQPLGQRNRNIPVISCPAAGAEDPEQIKSSPRVEREIRVEDRRNQDRATTRGSRLGLDVVATRAAAECAA